MCVLDGSCGKVQKKLRLCIVEKRDLAARHNINRIVSRVSYMCRLIDNRGHKRTFQSDLCACETAVRLLCTEL